jgi:ribosomal protein S18 acetylase RimI-like enzyme
MSTASPEILPCPPDRREEALTLVLSEIAPSQRREIAGGWLDSDSLFIALCDGQLRGAACGQRQPGNTAVLWPPRLVADESEQTAHQLAVAVTRALDAAAIGMTQALLPWGDAELVPVLRATGFQHLTDLLYLTCESDRFLATAPASELQFVVYDERERGRLSALIEQTYEATLDCPALNGVRRMGDVIDGYRATGVFRAENWLIARSGERPVGVLLLADHPAARHWELMYMGLVPAARGHGWGQQLTRHAQWLAKLAGVERIVLAVDAANRPALAIYERAGFAVWDRRSVFVRVFR